MKTNAERKAAERERMRSKGYILRHLWVHPKDWPLVQKYVIRTNKRREEK